MAQRPSNSVLPSLFRADWAEGVDLERAFSTSIVSTKGQVERRVGLLSKPYIIGHVSLKALDQENLDSTRLMSMLEKAAGSRPLVPVWSEFFTVIQDSIVGASSLIVRTTADRLIKAGSQVLICYPEDKTQWRYETATVSTLAAGEVFFTAGLSNAYRSGARVFLSMRSEAMLEASAKLVTRRTSTSSLSFREVHDPGLIEPTVEIGATIAGSYFNSIPILSVFYDWADGVDVARISDGTSDVVGLDNVTEIDGPFSRLKAEITFKSLDRPGATAVRNLFDSRGGRLLPFWLPWPTEDFKVLSLSTTAVLVENTGSGLAYLADQVDRHIAFVYRDGSISVARIASVTLGTSSATLTFANSISVPGSLRRASWCSLVRFDSDSMREKWANDEHFTASMPVIAVKTRVDGEDTGLPPHVDVPEEGVTLPSWNPFGGCNDGAPVPSMPIYEADCHSRDLNRPIFRSSDLVVPKKIGLEFSADWVKNPASLGATSLQGLIKALGNRLQWILEYDSSNNSASRHWHHLRYRDIPQINWDDAAIGAGAGTPADVDRHVFKTTSTYEDETGTSRTLEIRVQFEASDDLTRGAWGALCHIYVFTDELGAYTDGTSYNAGGAWTTSVSFTRDDPAIYEFTDGQRRCHPQLAICASVPTSMESACGFTSSYSGYDYTETPQLEPGLPWLTGSSNWYRCMDNSLFGIDPTFAAYMLGGDWRGTRLMEYVCIHNGLAGLNAVRPGYTESLAQLTFSSSISMAVCGPTGAAVPQCTGHPSSFNVGTVDGIQFSTPDACCFSLEPLFLELGVNTIQYTICPSSTTSSCLGVKKGQMLELPIYKVCWNESVPGYVNSVPLLAEWSNRDGILVSYKVANPGWEGQLLSDDFPGAPYFGTDFTSGDCAVSTDIWYLDTFSQYDYDPGGPPYDVIGKQMRPLGQLPAAPDPFDGMPDATCGIWVSLVGHPPVPAGVTALGYCGTWVVWDWRNIAIS